MVVFESLPARGKLSTYQHQAALYLAWGWPREFGETDFCFSEKENIEIYPAE